MSSATERGSLFSFCEVEHLLMNPYCTDSNFFHNFMGCVALGNSACNKGRENNANINNNYARGQIPPGIFRN